MIKRTLYWHNYTLIITLIKKCWQALSVPLVLTHLPEIMQLKFAELLIYMDTASPQFFFDQRYIFQVVTTWFRYEVQRLTPPLSITHDPQVLILNERLALAVDRVEHLADGSRRYLFYTFGAVGLQFIGQLKELEHYQLALVQLHAQHCRIVPLKPRQPYLNLEHVVVDPVNPQRCLACYRKHIMR